MSYSLSDLAKSFVSYLDKDSSAAVSLSEYQTYLKNQKLNTVMANNAISLFDINHDGLLSEAEILTGYKSFDTNNDDSFAFDEMIKMQNALSGITIDSSISQTQYNYLYSSTNTVFNTADTNKDNFITKAEYAAVLENNNYLASGADSFMNFYDLNGDGKVEFLEFQKKSIAIDTDKSGKITATEIAPFTNSLTKMTDIEIIGKSFISGLDVDTNEDENIDTRDGVVDFLEYSTYLTSNKLPASLAINMMAKYDADGSSTINRNEITNAYASFDKNADGTLSFAESIEFQNSISDIKFSTSIDQTQYTNLLSAGKSFMALDVDGDGVVSLEEYRAAIINANAAATSTSTVQPEYYAENLLMLFDQAQGANSKKDGKIDIFEYMQGVMKFDINNDGALNVVETQNLKNQLDNARLYNSVSTVVTQIDYNNDKSISTSEYTQYLISQGMPASLAVEAMNKFDENGDALINTLEMMNAYKTYDTNLNNTLDLDENLALFNDLSKNVVNLNVSSSNIKQYTAMFGNLKSDILKYDNSNDGVLNSSELQNYIKDMGLSSNYATNFLSKYDASKDGNIDLLELMKANIDFDADKNGTLNFTEQLKLDTSFSGVALNPTIDNQTQYQALFNKVKSYIDQYDLTKDNKLNQLELSTLVQNVELPSYFAQNLIANYGNSAEGTIDMLQLLKAYTDFDTNLNGTLEFNEELALNIDQSSVNLTSDSSNQKQTQALYAVDSQIVKTYDKTSDQKLNAAELGDYFKAKGFSASFATEAINLYDANKDGSLDAIELLKADTDFDSNTNGVIDNNEMLTQFAKYAKVSLPTGSDNELAISGNYQSALNTINSYDFSKDKNLSQEELRSYFKGLNLPDYVANKFLSLYDTNKDSLINNFELLKGLLDADTNKNGAFEFADYMKLFSNSSEAQINVTVDNQAQVQTLWNAAASKLISYDTNGDKKLSQTEVRTYFKNELGLPDYVADEFVNQFKNADGTVDSMQLTKAFAAFDANKSGSFDFAEYMNWFSSVSEAQLNVTAANQTQLQTFWNSAASTIATYDANADKKLSQAEVRNYFKSLNLPDYVADEFVNQFKNADGTVDSMQLTKAFATFDTNKSGSFDFVEYMNWFSSISEAQLNVTEDNQSQMQTLWNQAATTVINFDANGDKKLSQAEVRAYCKSLNLPDYMADEFITQYANADGTIDAVKLTKAFATLDTDKSGSFNFAEYMNWFSSISEAQLNVTEDNQAQMQTLWNSAASTVSAYDINGDKKLSQTEVRNYFKSINLPDYVADEFLTQYANADGTIDAVKLTKAFATFDTDKSGSFNFAEYMNWFSSISEAKINVTSTNQSLYNNLWNQAATTVVSFDTNGDKKLSLTEVQNWFVAMGLSLSQAQTFVNTSKNADGTIDAVKLASVFISKDTDQNAYLTPNDLIS